MTANLLSLSGLCAALLGIIIVPHRLAPAVLCLIIAGICDLFDGVIARRSRNVNPAGKELDSLIDAISFGVFPMMILLSLTSDVKLNTLIGILYVCCVVWRLANFNITPENRVFFTGLPVTYIALFLPVFLLPAAFDFPVSSVWLVRGILLLTALLNLSSIRIRKPGKTAYVIYALAAVAMIILWTRFSIYSIK